MSDRATTFKSVSKAKPCPVCEGIDGCSVGADGLLLCRRRSGEQLGFCYLGQAKGDSQYAQYRRDNDPVLCNGHNRIPPFSNRNGTAQDLSEQAARHAKALTPARRRELAAVLGLPEHVLDRLPRLGYSPKGFHQEYYDQPCWTFPEVDATGRIVGIRCRYGDGAKKVIGGGHQGIIILNGWNQGEGPILLPEGASCTLACAALGLAVVGRPSNMGGVEHLAALLGRQPADRPLLVVAELDAKRDSKGQAKWPGLDGAQHVAAELSARLGRPVPWVLPPEGAKDVRAWVLGQRLDATCQDEWHEAGERLQKDLLAHANAPATEDRSRIITADRVATIADLVRAGAGIECLWPDWIQVGVLNLIAGKASAGKTRFCADLVRRIRHGLPWPDGAPMTLAPESLVLWVVADNHHDEMVGLANAFGIADVVRINADVDEPYGGVNLDGVDELADLEARIQAVRPALVIIDTVGNATDRKLSHQEEAKAFYQPLQLIARRRRVAIVCLTHLSASGEVLGRRATEKVRVAIRIEHPDPDQPARRLEVIKSNAKYPPALGFTMGDHGNDYDASPPRRADERSSIKADAKVTEAADWLSDRVKSQPRPVNRLRAEAEQAGFSARTLYRAKDKLELEEYEAEGKKWWKLP
jgi:hypothetical protein